jgi:hypothetical protein
MSHLALKSGLTPRQADYVAKIQQAGQHLLGVINDILDFSRIEAGKLVVEKQPFMLDRVLEGMADVVGYKAGVKGLELVLDVAPDVPPHLVGDALRLGQILINFANNAIKFTERGEIHVRVRVVERHGRRVLLRFEVRDTGIGLSPEACERLFQPFTQVDASTTRLAESRADVEAELKATADRRRRLAADKELWDRDAAAAERTAEAFGTQVARTRERLAAAEQAIVAYANELREAVGRLVERIDAVAPAPTQPAAATP